MGTETRTLDVENAGNWQELTKAWSDLCRQDTYNRGHDSYNGSISHCELELSQKKFPTREAASKYLDSVDVQKRTALAVQYGSPIGAFPATQKEKELEKRLTDLQTELLLFDHEVLKRFVASKSASKKCTHCGSVISKKSRERLAAENFKGNYDRMDSGFDRRDYIREQTSCPACNHNLLMTDTDVKRKNSLVERARKAEEQKREIMKTRKAPAPYGYLVTAACPS